MRRFIVIGLVTLFVLAPTVAHAQEEDPSEGILIRVNGNATIGAEEVVGTVVVVNGDFVLEGTATTVVVVRGTANLTGATVETLVVVDGTANLGPDTVVSGDVFLSSSDLVRDPSAVVEGSVRDGWQWHISRGLWILGALLAVGFAVLTLLGGLVIAAVAPNAARKASNAITADTGQTILAALIFWIVVPIIGGLAFVTLIGIPTALAIWFALLPVVAFIGLVVTGIWIGELLVARDGGTGHPYLAVTLGLLILIIIGLVPFIGGVVVWLASVVGGGAVALTAWRAMRAPAAEGQLG